MTSTVRRIDAVEQDVNLQKLNASVVDRLLDGQNRLDKWLIRSGDLLSPIVVKETRQTLRSRQFVWTFGFLLLCILGWTFLSILTQMPGIYFYPTGGTLLGGYLVILTIPALIIIPIAAFFSMSSELNSNTFEVLSISPLSSHKIVWGKIVVAGVQLLIHISALAPCIALTYLLRGVSIISLTMIFPVVFVISFLLISIGVMFATFCRSIAQTVMFLITMLAITLIAFVTSMSYLLSIAAAASEEFSSWTGVAEYVLPFLLLCAGYGILALLVGGASIGIAGENYSRSIRIWLGIQSLLLFWFCLLAMPTNYDVHASPVVPTTLFLLSVHWVGAGIFVVSESGAVSIRAQRSLPTTFAGRWFSTFLNPGGGTGYFFVVCNFAACTFTLILLMVIFRVNELSALFAITFLAYVAFYLGFFRLIIYMIPREYNNRALSFLLFIFLFSLGNGIPYFLSSYLNNFRTPIYDIYCFSNPFWTFMEFRDITAVRSGVFLLYFLSFVIFCINAALASADVTLVRVRSPEELDLEKKKKMEASLEGPFAAE